MKTRRFRLTAELRDEMCRRIRAGAFPHVAAASLGVPHPVLADWLRRGEEGKTSRCRELFVSVAQAGGHARLLAEMEVRQSAPRFWLLHGPGKETTQAPGWSAPPRAAGGDRQGWAESVALLGDLLQALDPYPEARAAAAAVCESGTPPRERRG